MTDRPEPRLAFAHVDDVPWVEVAAQRHPGDQAVGARFKVLERSERRMVAYTRYDPGLILERHGHASDHFVFILEGEVEIGGRACPAGTLIVLEQGAAFGPLIAGPEGCVFLESYAGDTAPVPADREGYARLLAERGIEKLPHPHRVPDHPSRTGTSVDWG